MSRFPRFSREFASLLRRFRRRSEGAVAMMFAGILVPVLGLTGAALDYARSGEARAALQRATDAAALAAAIAERDGTGRPESVALSLIRSQLAGVKLEGVEASYRGGRGQHTVAANADMPTTLLAAIGWRTIPVRANSTAAAGNGRPEPMEIVFVFDTTVSMSWGTRWPEAVSAVRSLLTNLKGGRTSDFFASLVPLSDRINVSSVGPSIASWLGQAPPAGWTGCLEPRETAVPGFPHALDDTSPTASPRFRVSAPGQFLPQNPAPGAPAWEPVCPASAITGPTSHPDLIAQGLSALAPIGTGRFDEGMAWAWRLLSPQWRGRWNAGASYPAEASRRRKVAVLLTDGQTTAYDYEVGGRDGQSFGPNLGSRAGFAHLVHVCQRMRRAGIDVYVIQLPGNDSFTPFAKDCASRPDAYARAGSVEELRLALERIASVNGAGVRLVN